MSITNSVPVFDHAISDRRGTLQGQAMTVNNAQWRTSRLFVQPVASMPRAWAPWRRCDRRQSASKISRGRKTLASNFVAPRYVLEFDTAKMASNTVSRARVALTSAEPEPISTQSPRQGKTSQRALSIWKRCKQRQWIFFGRMLYTMFFVVFIA